MQPLRIKYIFFLFLAVSFSSESLAEQIYENFPETIHPDERYVIYSHGYIMEGDDPRPLHPEFGYYEFDQIKQTLFEDGGFNLIAWHRPSNIPIPDSRDILIDWVHRLLEAGVKPSRISMTGFSRGGHLTGYAGSRLQNSGINIALMAACFEGDLSYAGEPVSLGGNVLVIYETSDVAGSCEKVQARSSARDFREIAISTGLSHGAFFQPRDAWVKPLKDWIAQTNK